MSERVAIKQSVFGSREEVANMAACYHEWEPLHGVIFDYILVDAKCEKCGTFWGFPEEHK